MLLRLSSSMNVSRFIRMRIKERTLIFIVRRKKKQQREIIVKQSANLRISSYNEAFLSSIEPA